MRNRLAIFTFFAAFLAGNYPLLAQNTNLLPPFIRHRSGDDHWLSVMRSRPAFRLKEQIMNQVIRAHLEPLGTSYILPVVFHIIDTNPASTTDQDILNALQDLNNAFAAQGQYQGGMGVNTQIQFCLAQREPFGGNSKGITRTTSFYADMDQDLENDRLKNLIIWDPTHYINIWYVKSIQSETYPSFSCGRWIRHSEAGYATMPPAADSTDGIVVTGFGTLLVHEMGHYLGLYHTSQGLNCANTDCSLDGDQVCDTPPASDIMPSPACNQPVNSCSSDTSSGFSVDVPDMITNFMDFGNEPCHNAFTSGQAARMKAAITTQRSGLLVNECQRPCGENSLAAFTRDISYPVVGQTVNFTNNSTGATQFQWFVNDQLMSTNPQFSYTFSGVGKFKVYLKAFNGDPACFAGYWENVMVNCGVTARFYPDKRVIASKSPFYLDSVYFTNRSVGAISYQWLMSNDAGMAEQMISTGKDLNYTFLTPGNYLLILVAVNGACTDTAEPFHILVQDPTADATIGFTASNCYQENNIQVSLAVCNNGFAPIPSGIPVSFYDADPRSGSAHKLDSTLIWPDSIAGSCCTFLDNHILHINRTGLDTLFAVVADLGITIPVALPNTGLVEKYYSNNLAAVTGFQYKVTVVPATATLLPGDTITFTAKAGPGISSSYLWESPPTLSCSTCMSTTLIADTNTYVRVRTVSQYGCADSALAVVLVPPANDYTISIDSLLCAREDSLYIHFSICNLFKRGNVPAGLPVAFYQGDPFSSSGQLLGPVFITPQNNDGLCAAFHHIIKGVSTGNIYAVVNDNGLVIPVKLPADSSFLEKSYGNNHSFLGLLPDSLFLTPADTTVPRDKPFSIQLNSSFGPFATINWLQGPDYTLSCAQCFTTVVTPAQSTIVGVELVSPYGCLLSGKAVIHTFAGGKVSIPNAFTPNGDGHNEVFYVLGGREILRLKEFAVFNRWGQRIFARVNAPANDPAYGWNGMVNGAKAATGTYIYLADIEFTDGSSQVYKGTVTLVR